MLINIGVLAGVVAATGLLARQIEITNHAALILALASPVLMLAVPAAGLWFLLRRRWVPATGASIGTAVIVAVLAPHPAATVDGPDIRVMSANVLEGRADPAAVVDLARRHADVVCIQELTPGGLTQLSARGIDEVFPHRIVRPEDGGFGAGLWSRYPLRDDGMASEPIPITAGLQLPGVRTEPTVAVVHLSAPWPWPIEWWRNDIAYAAEALDRLDGTVVAAGDFNSTRDMAQFRRILDSGYRDAGFFAPTYPADSAVPPVLAIDHILTRNGSPSAAWTVDIPGSDHRAVLATVQVPR